MDHRAITDQLRHFASLNYRYQLEDTLASLEPHSEATVICLADALSDEGSDVRLLTIKILGLLGTKAQLALSAMIRALDDGCRIVRIAALEPVASFGTKAIDAIPILETWLEQSEDEFSRVSAAGHIPMIDPMRINEMSQLLRAATIDDSAIRQQAKWLLEKLQSPSMHDDVTAEFNEPKLTVQQLVTLLREPHPNHDFFEHERKSFEQQKLRAEFSPDAIQHVALGQLVDQRATEAVDDILCLIESPATTEEIRLHAEQTLFDITGVPTR
ncbi:MAG: HEAT repeat domain-containing protein [bacterium]|nr:HEAT repeat domain-containing protein [bacterium]